MTDVADTVEPAIEPALRAEALESLLLERGLVDTQTIETFIRSYETSVGPMNGAKVVAKAGILYQRNDPLSDACDVVRIDKYRSVTRDFFHGAAIACYHGFSQGLRLYDRQSESFIGRAERDDVAVIVLGEKLSVIEIGLVLIIDLQLGQ